MILSWYQQLRIALIVLCFTRLFGILGSGNLSRDPRPVHFLHEREGHQAQPSSVTTTPD